MSKNDSRIKALIAKVKEEKVKLGSKPKMAWETNALFKFSPHTANVLNLNTVVTEGRAIGALSFLLNESKGYQEACLLLGIFSIFQWEGYTLEQWTADFKLCVDKIKYAEEEKKFKSLEKKLKSLVSEEARTGMELDDIEGLLGLT